MIAEGLYVPTDLGKRAHVWHRYVIAEFNGMIRYSRGGNKNYACKAKTFENWIKRWKCKRTDLDGSGRAPTISPSSTT